MKAIIFSCFALCLLGCNSNPVEEMQPAVPDVVTPVSSGKVKSDLVGSWLSQSGMKSTMVLNQDGSVVIKSRMGTPGGMKDNNVTGSWSELNGEILMEIIDAKKEKVGQKFPYELKGDILTVKTYSGKSSSVYKRS